MPRWYVTVNNANNNNITARIISNTNTETLADFVAPISGNLWQRTASDQNKVMTTVNRYTKNSDIKQLAPYQIQAQIVPTPTTLSIGHEQINLAANGVNLQLAGLNNESKQVLIEQFKALAIPLNRGQSYPIEAIIDPVGFNLDDKSGAYQLTITPSKTTIIAKDEAGIFYAMQSLFSSLDNSKDSVLTELSASDAPRFEYRGVMVDFGRHFRSKEVTLRLIDQMARYKLNKLHMHLSDDEGGRIEIPGLPELTDIAAQRCHDLSEQTCLLPQLGSGPDTNNRGSGYFTRDEYIEIIKYANARFIEVIPEIDMPAHTRAANMAMEARYQKRHAQGQEQEANEYRLLDPNDTSNTTSVQFYNSQSYLNPCLDSSKHFVNKVITEIAAMHKAAGQPLTRWHFGGDEAKNIRLGGGYQDINAINRDPAKGSIDQRKEDHPWQRSQACRLMVEQGIVQDIEHLPSYFALQVTQLVKEHNINTIQAWQDGVKHAEDAHAFATDNVVLNFWDTLYWGGYSSANEWASKGYKVVISNPDYVYLDMPYEVNPLERGYYWATRFNDERKIFSFAPNNLPQNAETSVDRDGNSFSAKGETDWLGSYGLSAQIWGESIRTDEQMEYMTYPRLLAVAERAWHQANWELDYEKGREFKGNETQFVDQNALLNDWTRFANIMGQRELVRLQQAGIYFRLPIPGAQISANTLYANIALPGLIIEYSTDNGHLWQQYHQPVVVNEDDQILVRSRLNQQLSRSQLVSAAL